MKGLTIKKASIIIGVALAAYIGFSVLETAIFVFVAVETKGRIVEAAEYENTLGKKTCVQIDYSTPNGTRGLLYCRDAIGSLQLEGVQYHRDIYCKRGCKNLKHYPEGFRGVLGFEDGQEVSVLYDPKNPDDVRYNNFYYLWFPPVKQYLVMALMMWAMFSWALIFRVQYIPF